MSNPMTADTQAQGDLLKLAQQHGAEVSKFQGVEMVVFDRCEWDAFAAALQGRAQEGEPSDEEDAARYRWMRAQRHHDLHGKRLDAAIDERRAALAQAQKERVQGDAARAGGEG